MTKLRNFGSGRATKKEMASFCTQKGVATGYATEKLENLIKSGQNYAEDDDFAMSSEIRERAKELLDKLHHNSMVMQPCGFNSDNYEGHLEEVEMAIEREITGNLRGSIFTWPKILFTPLLLVGTKI